MVHVDLVGGLSPRDIAVDYLKNNTETDGIITTKPSLIKRAKELTMYTVHRYFLLDSMAYDNIISQQHQVSGRTFIEVLPGAMPKVIQRLCKEIRVPVIAGGLITDRESVMGALSSGAAAVSSTNHRMYGNYNDTPGIVSK